MDEGNEPSLNQLFRPQNHAVNRENSLEEVVMDNSKFYNYYVGRVQSLENYKRKLGRSCGDLSAAAPRLQLSNTPPTNNLERLKSDMVSLMEKDLSLMRQLLSLKETMDELKVFSSQNQDELDSSSLSSSLTSLVDIPCSSSLDYTTNSSRSMSYENSSCNSNLTAEQQSIRRSPEPDTTPQRLNKSILRIPINPIGRRQKLDRSPRLTLDSNNSYQSSSGTSTSSGFASECQSPSELTGGDGTLFANLNSPYYFPKHFHPIGKGFPRSSSHHNLSMGYNNYKLRPMYEQFVSLVVTDPQEVSI